MSLCLLLSIQGNAQHESIQKVVYDYQEKTPIELAYISTSEATTISDSNGKFSINFDSFLKVSHLSYDSLVFNSINQIPDTIWMIPKNYSLEGVQINSKRIINNIELEKTYNIKNFELVDDFLVVLEQAILGKGNRLSLYNLNGELIYKLVLEHHFESLFRNCLNQIFLGDDEYCYEIIIGDNNLHIQSKIDLKDYQNLFDNCVFYSNREWIYEFDKYSGLEKNIYSIKNNTSELLKKISNPTLIQMSQAYTRKLKARSEINSITTNNIGVNSARRNLQEDADFLMYVLFTENRELSYAKMRDGILIANTVQDSLHYLKTDIHNKSMDFKSKDFILNDINKKEAYLFKKINNCLYKIDENLELQLILKLADNYLLKMQIAHDKVFYLVKENSMDLVRIMLYHEDI